MKLHFHLSILFLSLLTKIVSQEDKILFAYQINRHGARAPFHGVKDGIDAYKEKWDQVQELSPVGKRMLYLLGVKARKRYMEDNKLLKEEYDPQEILIRSTDSNRTIESIQCYLQGLYKNSTGPVLKEKIRNNTNITYPPNVRYQDKMAEVLKQYKLDETNYALPFGMSIEPIHLFYKPLREFQLYEPGICKSIKPNYEKQIRRQEVLDFGDELYKTFGFLKDLENTKNETFLRDYDVQYKYMDGYICDDIDRRDFTYLKQNYNFNETTDKLLKEYSLKYLKMDYFDTNYPKGHYNISIAAESYTMHSLVNWMEKAKAAYEKKSDDYLKFVIYSAHDASIGALEEFMNYGFGLDPEYATFAETRFFEFFIDGKTNAEKVRYLRGDNTVKLEITFDEFKKVINEKTWTDEKVLDFCTNGEKEEKDDGKVQPKSKITTAEIFAICFGAADAILMIVLIIIFVLKKK